MSTSFNELLLKLYPPYTTVYGPYLRKDGRKHLILTVNSKTKKTLSYPKAIMEVHLNRLLTANETVDHVDRDFTNNNIDNLQILDRILHSSIDAKRRVLTITNCIKCNKEFALSRNQVNQRATTKAGPFCSKTCSGKYGTDIQNNKITPLTRTISATKYFRIKK